MNNERKISYEVRDHLGIIGKKNTGWNKELNLICWNGNEPAKFDIREWNPERTVMSKGVTLYENEMEALVKSYIAYKNKEGELSKISEDTEIAVD